LSTKGLPVTTTFAYQCLCGFSTGRLLTGYSPDGEAIELVKNDIGHIYRLCHWLDELHSKYSRWRMKKAAGKLRRRIQNLVSDMHCRIAQIHIHPCHPTKLPS
ncbi:hypothetical protein V1517DRAFT_313152, partial [Lipomyces orientalis]